MVSFSKLSKLRSWLKTRHFSWTIKLLLSRKAHVLSGLSRNGHQALGVTKSSEFIEFARIQGTSQGHWSELISSENFCTGTVAGQGKKVGKYTTSTFPIMLLICVPPPPFPPLLTAYFLHMQCGHRAGRKALPANPVKLRDFAPRCPPRRPQRIIIDPLPSP